MNLRSVYPKSIGPTPLTGGNVSIFLADRRYAIERFLLSNSNAGDQTATIYFVRSGGTPSTSNAIVTSLIVAANDVMNIPFPIILEVGDRIYVTGSTSINITFNVNEVELNSQ